MGALRRDFLPEDLRLEIQPPDVDGVISVQARQSVEETNWLLALAAQHDWIEGIVGWLPLADPNIREIMDQFQHEKKLLGLRHVVQDEVNDGFLSNAEFNRGIAAMKEFGWTYDLLIYDRQLPFAIPFVDRHPEQVFVLDHIAKPTIQSGEPDSVWQRDFRELAQRPNVYCKFSGVVTEVRALEWNVQLLQKYWDSAIEAFGSDRLMFGSDWPVCLLKSTYLDWADAVSVLAGGLSANEQANFWSANAKRAYRLALTT